MPPTPAGLVPGAAARGPAEALRLPPPPPELEHEDVMEGRVVELASPEDSSVVWLETDELEDSELRDTFRWNGRAAARPAVAGCCCAVLQINAESVPCVPPKTEGRE